MKKEDILPLFYMIYQKYIHTWQTKNDKKVDIFHIYSSLLPLNIYITLSLMSFLSNQGLT